MPCHAAMTPKHITVSPDQDVETALALMKKENIDAAPVVDKNGILMGVFSIRILMKNLLPVSVVMNDGLQLDVAVRAAPGIAKRLKKAAFLKVGDIMERKVMAVNPETPTWEGINHLVQNGGPLLVVESETGKLTGVITYQSALDELQRLKDSDS